MKQIIRNVVSGHYYNRYIERRAFLSSYNYARQYISKHPCPSLSSELKEEIDAYWSQYGIKFPDYSWHEMYYAATGIVDCRFIPDPIVGALYHYYNSQNKISGWDDKNLYEKFVSNVNWPKSICHFMHGKLYDTNWNEYFTDSSSINKFVEIISQSVKFPCDIILKKASDTAFGKGVKKYHIECCSDIESIIKENNSHDFIMQECIAQHDTLSIFNSSSVNVFRIITYRHGNDVLHLSTSLRFGLEGKFTDVAFVDGKEIVNVVGVNNDGTFKDRHISLDGTEPLMHNVDGLLIPNYDKLISMAKEGHKQLYYFDVVGWDYTIDKYGNPICIEYNILWPGTILYQYANGPYAGKYTDAFLEPLKLPEVRSHIPNKYIIKDFTNKL